MSLSASPASPGTSRRKREIGRFIGVGASGFFTDALVLTLLLKAGESVLVSRACSFACASLVTWWLHRIYTFSHRESHLQSKAGQYARYITIQILGAATNLGVFYGVVHVMPGLLEWPIIPLAIGSGPGLAVNFVGSSLWAFNTRRRS